MDTQLSWFDKLSNIVKEFLPFVSFAAGIFFPGSTVITKALGAIPKLMSAAEDVLGPGTGAAKSAYVTNAVKVLVETAGEFSTGGQAETFQKLDKLVPAISASIVAGVNTFDDPNIDSAALAVTTVTGALVETAKTFEWFSVSNPGV